MTAPVLLAATAACILVPSASDRITAGHLATRIAPFAAAPPETSIGYAPAPGARRILTAAELGRIATGLGLAGQIEEDACVERTSVPLDPARLHEAMQRSLPGAHIEIKDHSRFAAPPGEIEFPLAGLQKSGLWSGWVTYGQDRRFRIWARVTATVTRSEVVALEPLVSGRAITAEQVKVETAGRPPGAPAAESIDQVVGRLPRRSIAKGAAVRSEWLEAAPEVERGDTVRVQVRQGGARLEIDAVAETSGRRGDRIALRNQESKKRFLARVSGKGQAVIEGPQSQKKENP